MMNNELRPAEEAMLELGYDREDMKKPRVGVMNTWADYNPGHLHLKGVAQAVTEGQCGQSDLAPYIGRI